MAMVFQAPTVATIRAMSATSDVMYTINGVTADATTADNAANQINKLLAIGDKEIAADEHMYRTLKQEVVEE